LVLVVLVAAGPPRLTETILFLEPLRQLAAGAAARIRGLRARQHQTVRLAVQAAAARRALPE